MKRIAPRLLALVAAGAVCGCAANPISMQVQAGSTVMIPLPDSDFSLSPGFGSEVSQLHQDYDDQRGELVFYLQDPQSVLPDYRLKTRYVTRVYPESAASSAYVGQLLALADIPLPTDSPAGPNVSSPKVFNVVVKRRQRDLSLPGQPYGPETGYFATYESGTPGLTVTVIPGTGAPNPYVAWQGSMQGEGSYMTAGLYARLPYPQLVIQIGPGGAPGPSKPGAIQFDLAFPSSKLLIRGVSEWQSAGRYSVIRYRQIGVGVLRVWLVDPEESVAQLGVAFSLTAPTTLGRAQLSDFSISNAKFYQKTGASFTPTIYPFLVGIK